MSGGGKSSSYKSAVNITSSMQGVFVAAAKGYAGSGDSVDTDLSLDEFMETVSLELEKPDLSNIGHPLYRPFMARRFGYNMGNPASCNLAYDSVSGKYHAFIQLQEGMRVLATATYDLIDEFHLVRGNTIAIYDITMGVMRLFMIQSIEESDTGISLSLLDVLGG